MKNITFENLKKALKKREEENYARLREEIIKLRDNIEHFLTVFFESTASKAQTNYQGLEMY